PEARDKRLLECDRPVFSPPDNGLARRRSFYESRVASRAKELKRTYHRLLADYFTFLVPPGARVLEFRWGLGDLLAAVRPGRGVGVDFSPKMVQSARQRHPGLEFHVVEALEFSSQETFDYILVSDLVNDVPDVQALLARLRVVAHPGTRVI